MSSRLPVYVEQGLGQLVVVWKALVEETAESQRRRGQEHRRGSSTRTMARNEEGKINWISCMFVQGLLTERYYKSIRLWLMSAQSKASRQ